VIIPARGGSKRLPGKNIMLFGKLPLIAHSINYAKENENIIDAVVVSTDDKDIKKIALAHGASVIDRPKEFSGDHTPTIDVLTHAIKVLKHDYDNLILLQPTNPLRPKNLLKNAYEAYQKEAVNSLFTVSQMHHKLGKIEAGTFKPFNYEFGQRSQDMDALYYENGLLYMAKTSLIKKGVLMNEHSKPYLVEHPFAEIDIDTKDDFLKAEFYLKAIKQ